MPSRQWNYTIEVIGLRFRWKRDARRAFAGMVEQRGQITGVRIVREPENQHDENAIAVFLPQRIAGGKQLGYLHRETAAILAPKMDEGLLKVVKAELLSLNQRDDYNTGDLLVRFQDMSPKRSVKRKTKAV